MHSTSVSAAETVLGRFFEAAVAPELWPNALQGLAEACGAEGAAVNAIDGLRTEAVFHKTGGRWRLSQYAIGATDVWYEPYCRTAPKGLIPVCG